MTPPPAAAAVPRTRPRRPPAPRRVSGPAKNGGALRAGSKGTAPRGAATRARYALAGGGGAVALPAPGGLAIGLGRTLAGVSEQRWLDRLIRGRVWIGLIAFALIGIVAMQLVVVKLGVGVGRALEHEAFLQRENAALRIADAQLSSGERVEALAAARGMVVVAPGSQHFLKSRGALDARLAAGALARAGQEQQTHAGEETGAASGSGSGETAAASGETAAASGETGSAGAAETSAASSSGEGATGSGTNTESSTGEAGTDASGTGTGTGTTGSAEGASSNGAGSTAANTTASVDGTTQGTAGGSSAAGAVGGGAAGADGSGADGATGGGVAAGAGAGAGGASATGESPSTGGAAPGG